MKWFRLNPEQEGTGYLLVACTASKMYRFCGSGNWLELFAPYNPSPDGVYHLQPVEYQNASVKESQFR